jgi:hypothetical protein
MRIRQSLIPALLLVTLGLHGAAAAAESVRVRGAIVSHEGDKLVVHSREGADVTIMLTGKYNTVSVVKSSLADIKPGVFIGTAAAPQPDGTLKGLEVVLFPEALRGVGEGHYPWDLQPKSSMTNATVSSAVTAVDGTTLTLAYKGGEQKVTVPASAPVVTLGPATEADLVPGAIVFVPGVKTADGGVETKFVVVGKDGVTPPM